MFIPDPENDRKHRYRLLASHFDGKLGDEKDIFTLRVYHVSYPHAQPGKGWGRTIIAKKPHKDCQLQGLEEFLAWLEKFDVSPSQDWLPVENEEE